MEGGRGFKSRLRFQSCGPRKDSGLPFVDTERDDLRVRVLDGFSPWVEQQPLIKYHLGRFQARTTAKDWRACPAGRNKKLDALWC